MIGLVLVTHGRIAEELRAEPMPQDQAEQTVADSLRRLQARMLDERVEEQAGMVRIASSEQAGVNTTLRSAGGDSSGASFMEASKNASLPVCLMKRSRWVPVARAKGFEGSHTQLCRIM